MTRAPETIRRSIARWVDEQISQQGVQGIYWVDRTGWAQCPLVNPLCPDDLCVLPAGHDGTAEGYHVLGTTNYTHAYKYPMEWMMPVGTPMEDLYVEGVRRAEVLFPSDR